MNEFPSDLCPQYCGKGIGLWQLPNQLAPALLYINQFTIRSYVEVGCVGGGTFMFMTEFLRRTNALQGAACVGTGEIGDNPHVSAEENKNSPYAGILKEYIRRHGSYASYFKGSAYEYNSRRPQGPVAGAPAPSLASGTRALRLHRASVASVPLCVCVCVVPVSGSCGCAFTSLRFVLPPCPPPSAHTPCVMATTGLRLIFIDGNHFYTGVVEDFSSLERQGDIFVIDDIASDQFKDHTLKFYNELAAMPKFECRQFVDRYPTIRVLFGIGVCVRRLFVTSIAEAPAPGADVWIAGGCAGDDGLCAHARSSQGQ
jgi:hypothetical protein